MDVIGVAFVSAALLKTLKPITFCEEVSTFAISFSAQLTSNAPKIAKNITFFFFMIKKLIDKLIDNIINCFCHLAIDVMKLIRPLFHICIKRDRVKNCISVRVITATEYQRIDIAFARHPVCTERHIKCCVIFTVHRC